MNDYNTIVASAKKNCSHFKCVKKQKTILNNVRLREIVEAHKRSYTTNY